MMWSTRICFIAAVLIGLSSCMRGVSNSPPAAVSSPDSAPVPPPATRATTTVSSTVKPPVTQPATPRATTKANAPVAKTPVPTPKTTNAATAPDAPSTLDLTGLENQLKSTKAIGIFSKIALKNQVDDLMKQFREHYQGRNSTTMTELHQSYDLLIMKVLSLVQHDDKTLAAKIVSSRAAIWDLLSDPLKFAALDV